jgi:HAD superfamily hydrolase (TIGR01509 family)
MANKLEAIIFDMGGTLVDIEGLRAEAYKQTLAKYNIPNGDDWYYQHLGFPGKVLSGLAVSDFKLPLAPEEFREDRKEIYTRLLKTSQPQPIHSAIAFLRSISQVRYKLAIATSEHLDDITKYLSDIKLDPMRFSAIVSADEVERDKPAPDVYLEAAKRIKVSPANCLAIEDSAAGIRSAKSAGMICAAHKMPHNKYLDLSEADFVVDSFNTIRLSDIDIRFFRGY